MASLNGSEEVRKSAAIWPGNAPFALFLSHDIDQVHDREFFRVCADLNHIRRIVTHGEKGRVHLALRRIGRSLFWPKAPEKDFETILRTEAKHGFRSTFFLLDDPYWSRHGPRYTFRSSAIRRIARLILDAGGELGVHGGVYKLNSVAGYESSRRAVEEAFGVVPVGIRNHHLKFTFPNTWLAHEAAGFEYDCTYGWPNRLGPRECEPLPFYPEVPIAADDCISGGVADDRSPSRRGLEGLPMRRLRLLELPLTVMDTTLFRYLKLEGESALERAWECIEPITRQGGLVSLLWHNNYFNEPEYWDWQMVYEELLSRLASLRPWCATGQEICSFWRTRASEPGSDGRS